MVTSARASTNPHSGLRASEGLYDPRNEHDSCGVGCIADLSAKKSHKIITDGLQILANLTHRGAVGADPRSGDGAGILIQMPDEFFQAATDFTLPKAGDYAVGYVCMPGRKKLLRDCEAKFEQACKQEGLVLLGWRDVPTDNTCLSAPTIATEPVHRQIFIGKGPDIENDAHFERKLYVLRKVVSNAIEANRPGSPALFDQSISILVAGLPICAWLRIVAKLTRIASNFNSMRGRQSSASPELFGDDITVLQQ